MESSINGYLSNEANERMTKSDGLADEHYADVKIQKSSTMQRYQCGTCLQLFTARKHLRQHETLHTGEKRK